MSLDHPILHKLGASAVAIAIVVVIVIGWKVVDSSNRSESNKRAAEAHQIVFEACGSEAANRFERTFEGRNGWHKREEAEKWAADCAAKP